MTDTNRRATGTG